MAGSCARTEILVGQLGLAQLAESHVVIAGLGGVGGACAESLCRAGIGELTLIDFDTVSKTDLNRQLIALHSTLGESKVNVLAQRLRDINPDTIINEKNLFIDSQEAEVIATDSDLNFNEACLFLSCLLNSLARPQYSVLSILEMVTFVGSSLPPAPMLDIIGISERLQASIKFVLQAIASIQSATKFKSESVAITSAS